MIEKEVCQVLRRRHASKEACQVMPRSETVKTVTDQKSDVMNREKAPLANFLNNFKKEGRYRRKTCGTVFSINLVYSHKISGRSVEIFLRKWRFSDAKSRDFGSKNGQHSMTSRMYVF